MEKVNKSGTPNNIENGESVWAQYVSNMHFLAYEKRLFISELCSVSIEMMLSVERWYTIIILQASAFLQYHPQLLQDRQTSHLGWNVHSGFQVREQGGHTHIFFFYINSFFLYLLCWKALNFPPIPSSTSMGLPGSDDVCILSFRLGSRGGGGTGILMHYVSNVH